MCGRYSLALRPSQIRCMLEDDGLYVAEAPDDEGVDSPRRSYNFAPGYNGIVYRAFASDKEGERNRDAQRKAASSGAVEQIGNKYSTDSDYRCKLQSMKWGLVPSWTKRAPEYTAVLKTINCRSDSLSRSGGMWQGIKGRKRCIVIAQGFYEWLGSEKKQKQPHYIKRKDGHLMCLAGLWDSVRYEGINSETYTYTIITTDSNRQLRFLHDRMPVIFDSSSPELQRWIDPRRDAWSMELECSLQPFHGELEIYPVLQDVGKVGNDSPSFTVPLDSVENRTNIKRFFPTASLPRARDSQRPQSLEFNHAEDQGKKGDETSTGTRSLLGKRKQSMSSVSSTRGLLERK